MQDVETTQESSTEVQNQKETNEQLKNNVLFGTIGYQDDSAYENFIQNMNLSQAIFVLVASANFAQAKGAFNILESESLSTAIRVIRKNSSSQKTNEEILTNETDNGSNN